MFRTVFLTERSEKVFKGRWNIPSIGFQYGFSSGFPCRFCLIPYKLLQMYPPSFKYPQVWTAELYNKIVATLPQVNVPVLTVVPDEPEELIDKQYERPRDDDEDFKDGEEGQEGKEGEEGQDGDDGDGPQYLKKSLRAPLADRMNV